MYRVEKQKLHLLHVQFRDVHWSFSLSVVHKIASQTVFHSKHHTVGMLSFTCTDTILM